MTDFQNATRTCPWSRGMHHAARFRGLLPVLIQVACAFVFARGVTAQSPDIAIPPAITDAPVRLVADHATQWRSGEMDVWHLSGHVQVTQGLHRIRSDQMIVWIDAHDLSEAKKLIVYAEGDVIVEWDRQANDAPQPNSENRVVDETWLGRLFTYAEIEVDPQLQRPFDQTQVPAIATRAEEARRQGNAFPVTPVQFQQQPGEATLISPQTGVLRPAQNPQTPLTPASPFPMAVMGRSPVATRVEIHPRQSTVPLNIKTLPGGSPGEQVLLASGGVRITIDSREIAQLPELQGERSKRIYVLADNAVVWSNSLNPAGPPSDENAHWEVYLEGNVVFSVGRRTIYANQMYYDASYQRGTILRAEFYTPTDSYKGLLRMKADVLQQLDEYRYQAYGAALTTSRIGVPRYWLQSDRVSVEGTNSQPALPPPGSSLGSLTPDDSATGPRFVAESRGNRVYVGGVPVIYWPLFRTSLDNPDFYVKSIRVGNDRIFGTQVRTRLDLNQLLGWRPRNSDTSWVGAVDYLSERGIGLGTTYDYRIDSLFGLPGTADGIYRSWFIRDSGTDNLGRDRRNVPLEESFRGLIFLNHVHDFRPGLRLRAEAGYIRDRNFLEQYYQQEWDYKKDYATDVWLEQRFENQSLGLWGQVKINDFFTQTSWLPRADHFILGESILRDWLVYNAHSHIGYAKFSPMAPPTNPVDLAKYAPLAWELAPANGIRVGTRQGLELPLQLGPVRLVPFALADATYWGEDLTGNSFSRIYGQTGVRTSLPFWCVDPTAHSTLLNVNGLAHKLTIDSEFAYADANNGFNQLPLYDPLDDDAQEFFRRRFAFDTFNIIPGLTFIPTQFDERDFARRYAMQSYIASPTAEIANDLVYWRTGFRNRWQTKRGLPGRENIVDWVTFDIDATVFPRADRDNFGTSVGLVNYDFQWFIGDRVSVVSDGFFDFFSQGLKTASIGMQLHRPTVGDVYLGVRSIEGPISSNVLMARMNYRMSDKWGLQANSMYDFGSTGNIGQQLATVYIGESFLFRLGFNYDVSRGNFGVLFGIEPRFLMRPQLFRPGFASIPLPGNEYIE